MIHRRGFICLGIKINGQLTAIRFKSFCGLGYFLYLCTLEKNDKQKMK